MTALSGGAPEQAPRWDLMDTESCGSGIRFLTPLLIVWGYLCIYRRKKYAEGATRGPREWRVRPPLQGALPYLMGPSGGHRPTSSSYIYPRTPKTSREPTEKNFHCHNLPYPRDPILGPVPELRRRGHRSRRASTSSP